MSYQGHGLDQARGHHLPVNRLQHVHSGGHGTLTVLTPDGVENLHLVHPKCQWRDHAEKHVV